MMELLEGLVKGKYPTMDFKVMNANVCCLSHAINRCTQKVIDVVGATPLEGENNDKNDLVSPVKEVRVIVRSVRSSPQRRNLWFNAIRVGNQLQVFVPHVKELQLILDIHTHWDSTYQMIHCFLQMHQVSISMPCHLCPF